MVLDSLLSLQPATAAAGGGGATKEDIVTAIATDLVEQVPPPFNLEAVMRAKADDPSALHVVLFQEVERYNVLLVRVRKSCAELLRGIQGLVVMSSGALARSAPRGRSCNARATPLQKLQYCCGAKGFAVHRSILVSAGSVRQQGWRSHTRNNRHANRDKQVAFSDLDLVFEALLNGRVPPLWLKTYPSLKPLGAWTRDLLARVHQLARWVEDTYPPVYWLSGFTYPTGFLTAVLQTTARRSAIPIDTLSFEFSIVNVDPAEIAAPPKEGVYVHGVFLEGAGWDREEVRLFAHKLYSAMLGTVALVHLRTHYHNGPLSGKHVAMHGRFASLLLDKAC